jgi:hypothetical protein
MSFNFPGLLDGLQKGLAAVQALLPVATALGAPTELVQKVTDIAEATLETGRHVQEKIAEGEIVATSGDQSLLKSILERIEAENDQLAAYIEAN